MAGKKNGAVSFLVATFILAAALTLAQDNGHPPATVAPPAKFVNPSTTAHTAAATTTTHAAAPNTTAHTTAPNTTAHTAAPTTTTPDPPANTTVHANTTTAAPTTQNTTTTSATTTTATTSPPKPTPPANLTLGNYTIKDGSNVCIMLQAAIQIHVNNSKAQGSYIVQPQQTQTFGSCQTNTGQIELAFSNDGIIVLKFLKNDTTKMVYVTSVAVNLTYAFKSGDSYSLSRSNTSVQLFSMMASHSYSCKSEKVNMGDGISLEFSQERLQAFDFGNNGQFGPIDLCKADQPNYNVAIAVGIVLIVLIIIVVIAYLLSRRKRTDGYQTL